MQVADWQRGRGRRFISGHLPKDIGAQQLGRRFLTLYGAPAGSITGEGEPDTEIEINQSEVSVQMKDGSEYIIYSDKNKDAQLHEGTK